MNEELPAPPVPADAYVGDTPFPRDFFIEKAAEQFGISEEMAARFIDEAIERRRARVN